ncbi:MAG: hypothetical protein WCP21_24165 [Armatimonadota bacterium]
MRKCLTLIILALLPSLLWASPRQSRVTIRAFINVSSGCQVATVDFLKALKTRYAPNVSLELIDFGDQGRGFRRWQQSGYRCLTVEINGSPLVKFPYHGKSHAVAFQMPAGMNWSHSDLEQAVQAGVNGHLQRATQAEVDACAPARKLNATVATGTATTSGRRYSTVTINGKLALALAGASADTARRAKAAAATLRGWLAKPVRLSDLTRKHTAYGWAVLAAGQAVATATAADGKSVGRDPEVLADIWLGGIKHSLVGPGGQ